MVPVISGKTVLIVLASAAAIAAIPAEESKSGRAASAITREQIEADWLRQSEVRTS